MPVPMRAPVSGMAMRLVRRKYFGKVWKVTHTRGAVNIWQLMLRAMASHALCRRSHPGAFPPMPGYHAFMNGNSVKMPSIARYESWNPMEDTDSGENDSCRSSAVHQTDMAVLRLPGQCRAISVMVMNRKALTMEGDAPVIAT